MYDPKYDLTNKLVLQLINLEVEKSLSETVETSSQIKVMLDTKTKALNMFHMAHIMGVELTLKDAEKAAEGKKVVTTDARGTILNNYRNVLEYIHSNMSEHYIDIDLNTILHINKILLTDWKEAWEIKLRNTEEQVDMTLETWHNLFDRKISPAKVQDELLGALDWYKSKIDQVPDIIRIGVLLYQIIRIAPFLVLNKLTIICIAHFLFNKNGYIGKTFFPLARSFDLHDQEYMEALTYAAENDNNLTLWLERFIKNLHHDFSENRERIKKEVLDDEKSNRQPFLDLNKRQLKILRYLQTIPTVKREDYVQMMDTSTMTAYRDLNMLVNKKLLKVEGSGRGTKYMLSTR